MGQANPIPIRRYRSDDKNRILSDWAHVNLKKTDWRYAPRYIYDRHHTILEQLLPFGDTLCAVDPEMDSVIYGWICGDRVQKICHMCFVRYDFRNNGIGTALFRTLFPEGTDVVFTHKTPDIQKLGLVDKWGLKVYAPEIIGG